MRSTQFNLIQANPPPCLTEQECEHPEGSVEVEHSYAYGGVEDQGALVGRITTVRTGAQQSSSFSLGYGYDLWGNPANLSYPTIAGLDPVLCGLDAAPEVNLQWDAVALESMSLANPASTLLQATAYDHATGMMTSWQTPSGPSGGTAAVTHGLTPDGTRARPTSLSSTYGSTTFYSSGTFQYDARGNITDIGTDSYGYDALSRLTSSPGAATFAYDDFGNLLTIGGVTRSVDGATNRLDESGFAYDDKGNVTEEPMTGWTRHLRWDPGNRLMAAWASSDLDDAYAFAYDAAGERVLKYEIHDGQVQLGTFFVRDEGGNVLTDFQWVPSGTTGGINGYWTGRVDHVYLGRNEVVKLEPQLSEVLFSTLVLDHLGSTRAEVHDVGSWAPISYQPFGAHTTAAVLDNNARLFTAHEREFVGTAQDALQGLDYMHARYYSPNLGRFATVDPVGGKIGSSQSWNRYGYVRNNPLFFVDPYGLLPARVYGRVRDVEPGDIVVVRTEKGRYHVVMVGGFAQTGGSEDRKSNSPPDALVYEAAPQDEEDVQDYNDEAPHQPVLVNSNSPEAGAGVWNINTAERIRIVRNRQQDGTPFSEMEIATDVTAVGPIRYTNQEERMTSETDCAGFVNQLVSRTNSRGGTAEAFLIHGAQRIPKSPVDWYKEGNRK